MQFKAKRQQNVNSATVKHLYHFADGDLGTHEHGEEFRYLQLQAHLPSVRTVDDEEHNCGRGIQDGRPELRQVPLVERDHLDVVLDVRHDHDRMLRIEEVVVVEEPLADGLKRVLRVCERVYTLCIIM